MPAAIKQKLQASQRSQVGTESNELFTCFYRTQSKERKKGKKKERKKERKKEKGNAENVCRLSGTSRIFLLGD